MVEKYSKFVVESSVMTWPVKGCSMYQNSVENFTLVLSQHFPLEEGCLLSFLECFFPNTINIPDILL